MAERDAVARGKRVIVKIGSRTLATDATVFDRVAGDIAAARAEKKSIVLVSSGAIALGVKKLGYRTRPKEMARLQAAAAAGQSLLMRAYEEAFAKHGVPVAQVLLTHADLADRTRANNAREALRALLDAGAIPILNENDSVAVEEIRFGDNDQLSAMVAPLVDAEVLVLLSDVEGLLDAEGKRVPVVRDVAKEALPLIRKSTSEVGSGGMASKVEAARQATLAGADAIIGDARDPSTIKRVLAGDDVGTWFVAAEDRLTARRHWIAFTLRPRGDVVLDAGAVEAVRAKGKSVLPVGVLGVRGDFRALDAVRLLDATGHEIGRGLAKVGAAEAAACAGGASGEEGTRDVLVHRDDMIIWK